MKRSYKLPDGIISVLLAEKRGNEQVPTVTFAVIDADVPISLSDGRRVDQEVVPSYGRPLRLEKYFPSSGCGVQIEDGTIVYTEPGLRSLVGKVAATLFEDDSIIVAVGTTAYDLDRKEELQAKRFLLSCESHYM